MSSNFNSTSRKPLQGPLKAIYLSLTDKSLASVVREALTSIQLEVGGNIIATLPTKFLLEAGMLDMTWDFNGEKAVLTIKETIPESVFPPFWHSPYMEFNVNLFFGESFEASLISVQYSCSFRSSPHIEKVVVGYNRWEKANVSSTTELPEGSWISSVTLSDMKSPVLRAVIVPASRDYSPIRVTSAKNASNYGGTLIHTERDKNGWIYLFGPSNEFDVECETPAEFEVYAMRSVTVKAIGGLFGM